jgi:hypothetical protein
MCKSQAEVGRSKTSRRAGEDIHHPVAIVGRSAGPSAIEWRFAFGVPLGFAVLIISVRGL